MSRLITVAAPLSVRLEVSEPHRNRYWPLVVAGAFGIGLPLLVYAQLQAY